jgi:hypothetical protein
MPEEQNSTAPSDMTAEALALLKREVDALQVTLAHQTRPWYKDGSVLVSVLALLFSFGTTVVSYNKSQQDDVRARKAELRELILQLGRAPREIFEMERRFPNDPALIGSFRGFVNQESGIVAQQASQVIWSIPDAVSGDEHQAVASSLDAAGFAEQAAAHLRAAADRASDLYGLVVASRGLADITYRARGEAEGRAAFEAAIAATNSGRFQPPFEDFTVYHDALTHYRWAQLEGGNAKCDDFKLHLDAAAALERKLKVRAPQLAADIERARSIGCPPPMFPAPLGQPVPQGGAPIEASGQN